LLFPEYIGCSKKTDPLVYFDDNFGKCGPILILFSLLQQENYGAQKLSYFSHLRRWKIMHQNAWWSAVLGELAGMSANLQYSYTLH